MNFQKVSFQITAIILFNCCNYHQGQIIEKWESGITKKEWFVDKEKTLEKNYFENGHLKSEGNLIDNKKEKEWNYYYQNGNLKQKRIYREGKPFGQSLSYFENGMLEQKAFYDDSGLKDGNWEYYNSNGVLKTTGSYDRGKKIKSWGYFNEKGEIEREEFIDDYGDYEYVMNFNEFGHAVNLQSYFTRKGLKSEVYKVENSRNSKLIKTFFENGLLESEGESLDGNNNGSWKFWWSNGRPKAEGNFMSKEKKIFFTEVSNCKLQTRLPYIGFLENQKIGKWTYWNETGKKVAEIHYQERKDKIVEKIIYQNF